MLKSLLALCDIDKNLKVLIYLTSNLIVCVEGTFLAICMSIGYSTWVHVLVVQFLIVKQEFTGKQTDYVYV